MDSLSFEMQIILTAIYSPWGAYSGGGQRSTHNLAVALTELGFAVHVVFSKGWRENVAVPKNLPYELHWSIFPSAISRRNAPLRSWCANLTLLKVKEIVAKVPKDEKVILHCNGEEGEFLHKIKKRRKNCFIVATCRYPDLHEKLEDYFFGSLTQKMRMYIHHGKYLKQYRTIQNADFCAPPSEISASLISKFTEVPCQGIHNGVPQEFLKYSWKKKADGPIVFFGRLEHDKGVDVLLNALKNIEHHVQQSLMIIGKGAGKQEYEVSVSDLDLQDRVEFLDWMNHDDLGKLMESCSCVVLPSRKENFSLAVLGAMAVGVPIIATNSGGTEEVLVNHINGRMVGIDSVEDLAEALKDILTNQKKAYEMGENASQKIREEFTWKHTAQKFVEIYDSL